MATGRDNRALEVLPGYLLPNRLPARCPQPIGTATCHYTGSRAVIRPAEQPKP